MIIERDKDKPGTWKIDGRISSVAFANETFVAELKVKAKRAKYGLSGDRPRVTVEELVDERISDVDLTTAGGKRRQRVLRSFAAALLEELTVYEVKQSHFREWTKALRRRGLKPQSINRYLADVSVMFRLAPSMFALLEQDDWRPPKIPWEKESGGGKELVISADERRVLLEALRFLSGRVDGKGLKPSDVAARRDVADCFELALLSGMRGGEVRRLEWSEVDLENSEAHLPGHKTKTRRPRDVLLNTRAVEILRRRFEKRASRFARFVFPNEAGDGPRVEITRVVPPVARQLGLRYGRNLEDGFTPHSTRHTAATEMLRAGHDMKTVQEVLGHSDQTMTLHCSHSTRQSCRAAVETLVNSGRTGQKADKQK